MASSNDKFINLRDLDFLAVECYRPFKERDNEEWDNTLCVISKDQSFKAHFLKCEQGIHNVFPRIDKVTNDYIYDCDCIIQLKKGDLVIRSDFEKRIRKYNFGAGLVDVYEEEQDCPIEYINIGYILVDDKDSDEFERRGEYWKKYVK